MATTRTRGKTATKPVEPEVEDLEEDEVEETQPAKANGKTKAPEVEFGAKELAEYLSKKYDKKLDSRGLRTLLRKMARDGSGRIEREISQGNRTRYSWSGPKDPQVKVIEKAFADGELDADRAEKLEALKAQGAAKRAEKRKAREAAEAKAKKASKTKVVEVDDDEEDDDE